MPGQGDSETMQWCWANSISEPTSPDCTLDCPPHWGSHCQCHEYIPQGLDVGWIYFNWHAKRIIQLFFILVILLQSSISFLLSLSSHFSFCNLKEKHRDNQTLTNNFSSSKKGDRIWSQIWLSLWLIHHLLHFVSLQSSNDVTTFPHD